MNHDYYYHTCCVHSTARAINNMVDDAQDITWETFRKHVHWSEVKRIFRDYSYRRENFMDNGEWNIGFHIKDDWAVSFCKSKYKGKPCYYIVHSGIEYIFLKEE